jgi:hypothetical protein
VGLFIRLTTSEPKFTGDIGSPNTLDFLREFKVTSVNTSLTATEKIRMFRTRLAGPAVTWFDELYPDHLDRVFSQLDIDGLYAAFIKRFEGSSVQAAAMAKLAARKHSPGETYAAYLFDILSYCRQADPHMIDPMIAHHIESGLNAKDIERLNQASKAPTRKQMEKQLTRWDAGSRKAETFHPKSKESTSQRTTTTSAGVTRSSNPNPPTISMIARQSDELPQERGKEVYSSDEEITYSQDEKDDLVEEYEQELFAQEQKGCPAPGSGPPNPHRQTTRSNIQYQTSNPSPRRDPQRNRPPPGPTSNEAYLGVGIKQMVKELYDALKKPSSNQFITQTPSTERQAGMTGPSPCLNYAYSHYTQDCPHPYNSLRPGYPKTVATQKSTTQGTNTLHPTATSQGPATIYMISSSILEPGVSPPRKMSGQDCLRETIGTWDIQIELHPEMSSTIANKVMLEKEELEDATFRDKTPLPPHPTAQTLIEKPQVTLAYVNNSDVLEWLGSEDTEKAGLLASPDTKDRKGEVVVLKTCLPDAITNLSQDHIQQDERESHSDILQGASDIGSPTGSVMTCQVSPRQESNLLTIKGKVNNIPSDILIDTASAVSLISPHLLQDQYKYMPTMVTVKGVNQTITLLDEWVYIDIKIGNLWKLERVLVMKDVSFDLLLGHTTLARLGALIDYNHQTIHFLSPYGDSGILPFSRGGCVNNFKNTDPLICPQDLTHEDPSTEKTNQRVPLTTLQLPLDKNPIPSDQKDQPQRATPHHCVTVHMITEVSPDEGKVVEIPEIKPSDKVSAQVSADSQDRTRFPPEGLDVPTFLYLGTKGIPFYAIGDSAMIRPIKCGIFQKYPERQLTSSDVQLPGLVRPGLTADALIQLLTPFSDNWSLTHIPVLVMMGHDEAMKYTLLPAHDRKAQMENKYQKIMQILLQGGATHIYVVQPLPIVTRGRNPGPSLLNAQYQTGMAEIGNILNTLEFMLPPQDQRHIVPIPTHHLFSSPKNDCMVFANRYQFQLESETGPSNWNQLGCNLVWKTIVYNVSNHLGKAFSPHFADCPIFDLSRLGLLPDNSFFTDHLQPSHCIPVITQASPFHHDIQDEQSSVTPMTPLALAPVDTVPPLPPSNTVSGTSLTQAFQAPPLDENRSAGDDTSLPLDLTLHHNISTHSESSASYTNSCSLLDAALRGTPGQYKQARQNARRSREGSPEDWRVNLKSYTPTLTGAIVIQPTKKPKWDTIETNLLLMPPAEVNPQELPTTSRGITISQSPEGRNLPENLGLITLVPIERLRDKSTLSNHETSPFFLQVDGSQIPIYAIGDFNLKEAWEAGVFSKWDGPLPMQTLKLPNLAFGDRTIKEIAQELANIPQDTKPLSGHHAVLLCGTMDAYSLLSGRWKDAQHMLKNGYVATISTLLNLGAEHVFVMESLHTTLALPEQSIPPDQMIYQEEKFLVRHSQHAAALDVARRHPFQVSFVYNHDNFSLVSFAGNLQHDTSTAKSQGVYSDASQWSQAGRMVLKTNLSLAVNRITQHPFVSPHFETDSGADAWISQIIAQRLAREREVSRIRRRYQYGSIFRKQPPCCTPPLKGNCTSYTPSDIVYQQAGIQTEELENVDSISALQPGTDATIPIHRRRNRRPRTRRRLSNHQVSSGVEGGWRRRDESHDASHSGRQREEFPYRDTGLPNPLETPSDMVYPEVETQTPELENVDSNSALQPGTDATIPLHRRRSRRPRSRKRLSYHQVAGGNEDDWRQREESHDASHSGHHRGQPSYMDTGPLNNPKRDQDVKHIASAIQQVHIKVRPVKEKPSRGHRRRSPCTDLSSSTHEALQEGVQAFSGNHHLLATGTLTTAGICKPEIHQEI